MDKIAIENLSLQYADGTESLRNINMGIRENAVMALARPSMRLTRAKMRSATSGVLACRARMCSAPMNSVTSPRTDVPPAATTMSEAIPTAGVAKSPCVVSEAPHLRPRTRSETGWRDDCTVEASATSSCARRWPRATECAWPPSSWITRHSTRLPDARISSATSSKATPSHPRPTKSTPARLGFRPSPTSARLTRARSTGVCPQP